MRGCIGALKDADAQQVFAPARRGCWSFSSRLRGRIRGLSKIVEGVDKAPSRKVSLVLIGHTAMDYILDPINDALFATTRCYDDGDNDYDDDADDVVSRESRQ